MPGIGVISNPYAKVNKNNPENNTSMWYILGNQGQFEVTNTVADLSRVCHEFENRGIDLIGIVGGDGTISLTLSAIYEAYRKRELPRILLLRGGTVNVAATNLGIYGKPKDVMADFVEKYHSGAPVDEMPLDTLMVNGRLGFLFANGMASNFLHEFYKNKSNAFGAGVFFAKVLADTLADGKITGDYLRIAALENMHITTSPLPWVAESTTYSNVFVSTLPCMPFGLEMYKNLIPGGGKAELIAMCNEGRNLLPAAGRILLGRKLNDPKIYNSLIEKANIEVDKGARYSLDGDLLNAETGKISIEVGPRFVFCSPYGKVLKKS